MKEKYFFKNSRLFSDYYLKELLPNDPIWEIGVSEYFKKIKEIYERKKDVIESLNEPSLEDQFIRPILRVLGHKWEVQPSLKKFKKPDYSFYKTEEEKVNSELSKDYFGNAIAVGEVKRWGRPLDKKLKDESDPFEVYSPSLQMERYLWLTEVKWGILTNGRLWRIYERNTSNKLDIYYEVDLVNILKRGNLEDFKYFYLFFRKKAFPDFLDKVYEESIDYAQAIGEDLKSNVYKALRILANGFLQTPGNDLSIKNLQEIYDNSLIFLYRLLFILYAEARGLLPLKNPKYRDSYSFYSIKNDVAKKIDRNEPIPILQKGYWSRVNVLCDLINNGSESYDISKDEFFIPPYNGGLFDPDKNKFLEENEISDHFIVDVIDLLSRSVIKNEGGKAFVDYSSLDIRHLGSIYEGLLENKLEVAQEDMSAIKRGRKEIWIKTSKLGKRKEIDNVSSGQLYPVTDKGERKATGSYYTPDYIVKYIVENTIGPLVEDKKHKVEKEEDLIDEILSLKILDPAMGSGHFLVEATDFIAKCLVEALGVSPKEVEEEDIIWARREVVERCIYGVDLNPLAVELTKLSLWLSTVSINKPLSFLDHHLKCGNSLIGARIKDLGKLPKLSKRGRNKTKVIQVSLFEQSLKKRLPVILSDVMKMLKEPSDKVEQIKEKENIYNKILDILTPFKDVSNIWMSIYFDNANIAYEWMLSLLESQGRWGEVREKEWFRKANILNKENHFFHWELEFPEIFFDEYGREKDNPGFDVVIGNPPYIRQERIKEQKPLYENFYTKIYSGRGDICIYFIEKSLDLTKLTGYHSFIITNKWLRAKYGENIRKYITEDITIDKIIDFTGVTIFEDSTVDALVYIFKNVKPEDNKLRYCDYKDTSLQNIEGYVVKNGFDIEQEKLKQGWTFYPEDILGIKKKIEKVGKPLKEWDVKIKYGIKTGFNKAFIIDEKIKEHLIKKDPKSAEIIKPILRGRDIGRYGYDFDNKFIIISKYKNYRNIINNYPAVYEHLKRFKEKLENRGQVRNGQHHWLELDNNPQDEYLELFEKPKIVWQEISERGAYYWDGENYFVSNTGYIMTNVPKYVLTILNSKLMDFYFEKIASSLSSKGLRHIYQFVELQPIPELTEPRQTSFIHLCDYMLFLNKTEERRKSEKNLIEFFDKEIIDSLVYELYFFNELKTNLFNLIFKYLVDISNIDSDSEKLNMIKEVYNNLLNKEEIKNTIEKIKSHLLINIIEESFC